MKVMVTGGAGYIGSHVVRALQQAGHGVVVYDDLSTGNLKLIKANKVKLWEGDIQDRYRLGLCMKSEKVEAVIHLAGRSQVGGSVANPSLYYKVNVEGSRTLLECCVDYKIRRFVFSSTAAVYGEPESVPIPENAPRRPINPYGRTKLAIEFMLEDFSVPYGIGVIALRYFNVAGASDEGDLGELHDPETHLIPNVLRAARRGKVFKLFGTDYDTRDGTCVRDYIHVVDLARAHLRAIETVDQPGFTAINLGSGEGATVREVLTLAINELEVGLGASIEEADRRPGDPPALVASNTLASTVLDWRPQKNLADMISSAYRFMLKQEEK